MHRFEVEVPRKQEYNGLVGRVVGQMATEGDVKHRVQLQIGSETKASEPFSDMISTTFEAFSWRFKAFSGAFRR